MSEPLSEPVFWMGAQWAVTSYGIEALNGKYHIPREDLRMIDWPAHMAVKNWVWEDDFKKAYEFALKHFGE
jgi:hypothetical protein